MDNLFKGQFHTSYIQMEQKMKQIKGYVFDWDGVFNNGQKDQNGTSPFNEIDAMGTNLIRFGHFLKTGKLPVFIIISGEHNSAAQTLAKREHFNAVYSGFKFKSDAMDHCCQHHALTPENFAFAFDDVLDFSLAQKTGLRMMVHRSCNALLHEFAAENHLVDYTTKNSGNKHAVREISEVLLTLQGNFKETISERMNFSNVYKQYLQHRNSIEPAFFSSIQNEIKKQIL